MESENEEDGLVSYKNKYRQLKSRLKYLIYVSIQGTSVADWASRLVVFTANRFYLQVV